MSEVKNVVKCGSCLKSYCVGCSNFIRYKEKKIIKKSSLVEKIVGFFKLVLNFN